MAHFKSNKEQAQFGLAVGTSLITVAARILPAPPIKYRDARANITLVIPRFGSRNMANIKFHTGSNLGPWTYIWFRSNRGREYFGEAELRTTVMNFKNFLNRSGINASNFITAPPPPVINLINSQEGANDVAIKNIF